ncbi:PilZ domain-containing protein [Desulfonatronovibrio hydrogenovorans]|uniref:PilZ domain-containing protein n=1 Tax=Desulfonatronovibrio hydrogenovorans TaxID=53245 RepID=UPI000491F393|nr:PilZ domain-containing protein [Desulfonatronovibrio hydrogenovorans]
MQDEKRKRFRISLDLPVVIKQGDIRLVSMTRDISLKGLRAEFRSELEAGSPCSLSIRLSSGVRIDIQAVVKSSSSRGTSFDFIRINEQSFFHLRNLIRLYSDDPDQVDRELFQPAFDPDSLNRTRP